MSADPLSAEAFDYRYRSDPDPWRFDSSSYEQSKYDVTIAALSRSRYRFAYEPGCSIGALTERLAARADRLIAADISPTAVRRARERLASSSHVTIECADVLQVPPHASFDLIVLSEIGYYFDPDTLADLARRLEDLLEPNGELLAVHWLGDSADHVLHGNTVHEILHDAFALHCVCSELHRGYRLDKWSKS